MADSVRCFELPKQQRLPEARRSYFQFNLAASVLPNVDAVIFDCAAPRIPRRIFVVPQQVLLSLFEGATASRRMKVYLPTQKLPVYRNQRPRVDYWKYQDAWHHLRPRKNNHRRQAAD